MQCKLRKALHCVDYFPTQQEILGNGSSECPICQKLFTNSSALQFHCRLKHKAFIGTADPADISEKDRAALKARYFCCASQCTSADRFFPSMKQLKQHYQKVHMQKKCGVFGKPALMFSIPCTQCSRKFSLQRDLDFHVKSAHAKSPECSQPREISDDDYNISVINSGKLLQLSGPMPPDGYSLVIRRSGQFGVNVNVVPIIDEPPQRPTTSSAYCNTEVWQESPASQAAPNFIEMTDFASQINFPDAPLPEIEMRTVETMVDPMFEDWRSIETQTTLSHCEAFDWNLHRNT